MNLMRSIRRLKYLRTERRMLAARAALHELAAFTGQDTPPAYVQQFIYTLAKEIGEHETKLDALRKEGI